MKLLLLMFICLSSTALIGATIQKTFNEKGSIDEKKLWLLIFPLYCLSLIFSVVTILIPNSPIIIKGLRDVIIFTYLFSTFLYALSLYFQGIPQKHLKPQVSGE